MTSVQKEIIIDADPADVWAVVGDFTDGPARERLIGIDDRTHRLAYSVIGDTMQPTHDSASMQVFSHRNGRSRFVWIHDVQPDDLADADGRGNGSRARCLQADDGITSVATRGVRLS